MIRRKPCMTTRTGLVHEAPPGHLVSLTTTLIKSVEPIAPSSPTMSMTASRSTMTSIEVGALTSGLSLVRAAVPSKSRLSIDGRPSKQLMLSGRKPRLRRRVAKRSTDRRSLTNSMSSLISSALQLSLRFQETILVVLI